MNHGLKWVGEANVSEQLTSLGSIQTEEDQKPGMLSSREYHGGGTKVIG